MNLRAPFACSLALLVVACGEDSTERPAGFEEPFRIRNGQFFEGDLPGLDPSQRDAAPAELTRITDISFANPVVLAGQAGKKFKGRATDHAVSVGLRFADVGTGYWVMPVGAPEHVDEGLEEMTWSTSADFRPDVPEGFHQLRVVAFDAAGNPGVQGEARLCVSPRIPDNGHLCDPRQPLPAVVIHLSWHQHADLDLEVRMPDGELVTPKSSRVGEPVEGDIRNTSGIDRDGGASCTADARLTESLILLERPRGTLSVFANLFDACKQSSVSFTLSVWEPRGEGEAAKLEQVSEFTGSLTDLDANGGAATGRKIADLQF